MASLPEHLSNSAVQSRAADEIIVAVSKRLGVVLSPRPHELRMSTGTRVVVDAASADEKIVVEAYARQGKLKGAQLKKIAQDILKLALLKRDVGREQTKAIIALASVEAHGSISGWLREAADAFGVDLMVVEIPDVLRRDILAAQERQVMVNLDYAADDLDVSQDPL